MKKLLKITFTLIFTTILLLGFAMPLNQDGNWYQQFMPNFGNQQIRDITFLDSLTGFAVTSKNINPDTSSILKTTNGGDNWQIVFTQGSRRFSRVKFISNDTGFVCGGTGTGTPYIYKTTNAGLNWNIYSTFGCAFWNDMQVLSNDAIWVVDSDGLCGGVFRTTNGGASWDQQLNLGSLNPKYIYMFNARIGYICIDGGSRYIRKTTDGGASWNLIVSNDYFSTMHFTDSLTGWKCSVFGMKKTTDGGLNWVIQTIPSGGIIQNGFIGNFVVINKDTLIGTGGNVLYPNGQMRGIIYRTTDGGNNWLFQVPDTNINILGFGFIEFTNKNCGWLYNTGGTGIHTTTGGDPIWVTGITQISTQVPKDYKLYQNYPNPFNPVTNIKYSVKRETSNVKLIIFDVTGREIITLVNAEQQAGTYEVDWNAAGYSSGIYFYSLITDGILIETKKMLMVK